MPLFDQLHEDMTPHGRGGGGGESESQFGDPHQLFSQKFKPDDIYEAIEEAEFIWNSHSIYSAALQKVVRYFITEVIFSGVSAEEAEDWDEILNDKMNIMSILSLIGDDYLSVGNSITSIYIPFTRFLRCPRDECRLEVRLDGVEDYRFEDGKFRGTCPGCGHNVVFSLKDYKDSDASNINIIRWDIKQLDIRQHPVAPNKVEYRWNIPSEITSAVKSGDEFIIKHMPIEILKAIEQGGVIELSDNLLKHIKTASIAGIDTGGLGVPPVVSSYADVWYDRILMQYNQTIAADYMLPFRFVTPASTGGGDGQNPDPVIGGGGAGAIMSQVLEKIREQRDHPTQWTSLPVPVQQGFMNGEGKSLAAPKLMEHSERRTLNGLQVPMEFFQGNLRWRGDPAAIRLMERTWEHLYSALNSWLSWLCNTISTEYSLAKVKPTLQPPSLHDNYARKQLLLQLQMQGKVSKDTAWGEWNLDPEQELKNTIHERIQEQNAMEEAEKNQKGNALPLQQPPMPQGPQGQGQPQAGAAGPGAPPGGPMGGSPAPGGGDQNMNVQQMKMQAESIAKSLLQAPESIKDSKLKELSSSNELLHALVSNAMDEFRDKTNLEGGVMLRQQMMQSRQ